LFPWEITPLVTADEGGFLKAWNVAAREELFDLYHLRKGVDRVRFSGDGSRMAFIGIEDWTIHSFDVAAAAAERSAAK
jgi:hypothetical protein